VGTGHLEIVKELLSALGEGKSGDELSYFYAKDVILTEYPNSLSKKITERNFHEILEASIRGKQAISKQKYEIVKSYSVGDVVIIEAIWTGILSIPVGKLAVGDEMKAYFAQFIEFKNGKIIKQRTYDCFENFL
jgi:hypothetical protein